MNNKEISEAQELIDSVRNGTGELAPAKAAFPSKQCGICLGTKEVPEWVKRAGGYSTIKSMVRCPHCD